MLFVIIVAIFALQGRRRHTQMAHGPTHGPPDYQRACKQGGGSQWGPRAQALVCTNRGTLDENTRKLQNWKSCVDGRQQTKLWLQKYRPSKIDAGHDFAIDHANQMVSVCDGVTKIQRFDQWKTNPTISQWLEHDELDNIRDERWIHEQGYYVGDPNEWRNTYIGNQNYEGYLQGENWGPPI